MRMVRVPIASICLRAEPLCFMSVLAPCRVNTRIGHVGLCVGEAQVIHAWDKVRQDHYLDVESLTPAPGWTAPRYVGWTSVERIFVGYREKKRKRANRDLPWRGICACLDHADGGMHVTGQTRLRSPPVQYASKAMDQVFKD